MPTTLPLKNTQERDSTFRITGRTVLFIFCGFFGVIFAVNGIFMTLAISTFGGIDAAGAYRENFLLTKELVAAQKQDALGWSVNGSVKRTGPNSARIEITARDKTGSPINIKSIKAEMRRPADERLDGTVHLHPVGTGRYTGEASHIGPGQWEFILTLYDRNNNRFLSKNRLILK